MVDEQSTHHDYRGDVLHHLYVSLADDLRAYSLDHPTSDRNSLAGFIDPVHCRYGHNYFRLRVSFRMVRAALHAPGLADAIQTENASSEAAIHNIKKC